MQKVCAGAFLLVLLLTCPNFIRPSHGQRNVSTSAALSRKISEASNAFGLTMFHTLRATSSGNLFFSPLSVFTALGMLFAGSAGSTRTAMQEVLHLSTMKRSRAINAGFLSLMQSLTQPSAQQQEGMQFSMANALYVESDLPILRTYVATLRNFFLCQMRGGRFTERLRQRINSWVAEQTQEMIQDLLPSGALEPATQLALVNAIYFKGIWETSFDPANTRLRTWFFTNTNTTQVPTMYAQAMDVLSHFSDELGASYVEVPFKGNVSMYLLNIQPPRSDENLPAGTEAALDSSILQAMLDKKSDSMATKRMSVSIPKLDLSSDVNLRSLLSQIGLSDITNPKTANFSRITRNPGFHVGQAFHQSVIQVDEKGATAAAATAIIMTRASLPRATFNGPFLFFIVEKTTKTVLFLGRVVDPRRNT